MKHASVTRAIAAIGIVSQLACRDGVSPLDYGRCDPPASAQATRMGLEGESVVALAQTPWGWYAGTSYHGIFRCGEETGNRWRALGLDHAVVSAILFVPGPTPRLLVGMAPRAEETTPAAVFATEDRGATWVPWDGGLASTYGYRRWAHALAIDPGDPSLLFMGEGPALLRSADTGRTWQYVSGQGTFGDAVSQVVVSPLRDGRVYAGAATGFYAPVLFRSEDWGLSWQHVFPLKNVENYVGAIAVDSASGGDVWIGLGGLIMRSNDHGLTWEPKLTVDADFGDIFIRGNTMLAAGGRWLSDSTTETAFSLYRSLDSGETWNTVTATPDPSAAYVAVLDSLGRIVIGTKGGVWRIHPD